MGLCVTLTPATWVDPFGLFTSLEDYKYQLEKKLADPLISVYLEPGLREAALGYLHDSMSSDGRNGVLDLSIIAGKNTPESKAIIGAIRKLSGVHGESIINDYLANRLDAIASINNYSPTSWYIFDTTMLGYFAQLSCSVQQLVNSEGWSLEKFNEKSINAAAIMASEVDKAAMMMLGYTANLPKGNDYSQSAGNVDNFIKNNVHPNFRQSVKEAFGADVKVTKLSQDTIVYRYSGGTSSSTSYWYTPYQTSNPAADLALPPGNTYQNMNTYLIPKGTTVLEGSVAPNFGQPGGGYQYYVPNPSVVISN